MCSDPPAVLFPLLPLPHPSLFLVYLSSQGLCKWIPGCRTLPWCGHMGDETPRCSPRLPPCWWLQSLWQEQEPGTRVPPSPVPHESLLWRVFSYFLLFPEGSRVIPSAQHSSGLIQAFCPLWVPGDRLANLRGSGLGWDGLCGWHWFRMELRRPWYTSQLGAYG